MKAETPMPRVTRWLLTVASSGIAFALMIAGALIGQGLAGKLFGAALGAFLGGLLLAQINTARRNRFVFATGWSAFAAVGGAAAYGVFAIVPHPSSLWVFPLAGAVGGLAGGLIAALIQGPVLWTLPRMRVQWSIVEVTALTIAGVVFLLTMRLGQPALAVPLAALAYGGLKQFQPATKA